MEYDRGTKITIYICYLVFASIAFLSAVCPGRTAPSARPFVIAVFLGFAFLAITTALLMHVSAVVWNDARVSGVDAIGRRRAFGWSDLSKINYVPWAQSFRLQSKDGTCIWVSPMMLGFRSFHKKLALEAKKQGIKLPT